MSGMRRFTFDVESIELQEGEMAEYATLVSYLCHNEEQHRISNFLAGISAQQGKSAQDYAQRQALRMWRTGVRLLVRNPILGGWSQ